MSIKSPLHTSLIVAYIYHLFPSFLICKVCFVTVISVNAYNISLLLQTFVLIVRVDMCFAGQPMLHLWETSLITHKWNKQFINRLVFETLLSMLSKDAHLITHIEEGRVSPDPSCLNLQYLCCSSLWVGGLGSVCYIWSISPVLSGVLCECKYALSNSLFLSFFLSLEGPEP